mmetsp:Transcript_68378/g.189219  ORF Transcript_68378/g.189219 Transcript_68378/m.189219 type:complete len:251 (-) Transcript_68378:394-1146(-)
MPSRSRSRRRRRRSVRKRMLRRRVRKPRKRHHRGRRRRSARRQRKLWHKMKGSKRLRQERGRRRRRRSSRRSPSSRARPQPPKPTSATQKPRMEPLTGHPLPSKANRRITSLTCTWAGSRTHSNRPPSSRARQGSLELTSRQPARHCRRRVSPPSSSRTRRKRRPMRPQTASWWLRGNRRPPSRVRRRSRARTLAMGLTPVPLPLAKHGPPLKASHRKAGLKSAMAGPGTCSPSRRHRCSRASPRRHQRR